MSGHTATAISTRIETQISNGDLAPGDQLVSVRELATRLGVSPNTVSAAYRKLRERGVVVGRGRQGTRVAPRVSADSLLAATVPAGAVDALSGTPDPNLIPPLRDAFLKLDDRPQARYGDAVIEPALAQAAKLVFDADGIDGSHFAVTSGSMDAIDRMLNVHGFRSGDRIGVEDPGHTPVHQLARRAGLELVPLPIDDQGATVAGLAAGLRRGLSAVVLTPRAQNPTGAAFSPQRAADLSETLSGYPDTFVIQDDHAGPVAGVSLEAVTPPGPRWATIRSLGKSLGADLRVALVAADEQTAHRVSVAMSSGPGWVSHLLQRAAAYLLTDPGTTEMVRKAAASYEQRRLRLISRLEAGGIAAVGTSGLNVWIPTSDEQAGVDAAREAGYAIRAADPYRLASPSAVRVTITLLDDTDIDAVADALITSMTRRGHAQSV